MIFEHEKEEAKHKAKEVLELAKIKERENGYKTMIKDKKRVLVNPNNFESKLEQGYKFVS